MLTLGLIRCGQKPQESAIEQVTINPELDSATIRSQKLYETYCTGCHGEQMMAFADRTWKHGNTKDSLILSITNGYAEAGMPKWGEVFSDEQITELADYIRTGIEHVEKYGFDEVMLSSDTFQTEQFSFSLDTIVSGMTNPWGMTFLPSGEFLITEKSGTLFLVDGEGNREVVKGTPDVRHDVQGGLLDIILHPDFKDNQWLYISYSDYIIEEGDTLSGTAIDRFTYQDGHLTNPLEIFRGRPYTSAKWHYGSRMAFDEKGYLFFTASDRAHQSANPQDLSNPKGKIHRMYDDGGIPEDNPFFGKKDTIASIYTYGHRNAQGLAFNSVTNEIWSHEHGPRGGDELNLVKKGVNYGWPVISYGINYDGTTFTDKLEQEGMEQPIHYWVPSIAPCGMTFVESDLYPGWKGDILIGSLRFNYLNRCIMDGQKVVGEETLMKNIGRLRNVKQGPDGYIYVAVEDPGYVFRLVPIKE
ncbi:PQQ-dependent sugar dehydrogenase [Reichenbachiella ulvae]|uniref:PQQ-dependent sugar dehydrogenase n=1 Tax=Reichenbachiella ulvae TaxID=2980104 RepID=A0ABT3CV34_9BACT|nr:PQQ-dependent sugar dehydrogenase [Reichenbachiella ulvae]MCV9387413.1 PQQ-dependent sugar dehydrogenase [Reichenbachiella ulvae]